MKFSLWVENKQAKRIRQVKTWQDAVIDILGKYDISPKIDGESVKSTLDGHELVLWLDRNPTLDGKMLSVSDIKYAIERLFMVANKRNLFYQISGPPMPAPRNYLLDPPSYKAANDPR